MITLDQRTYKVQCSHESMRPEGPHASRRRAYKPLALWGPEGPTRASGAHTPYGGVMSFGPPLQRGPPGFPP